MSKPKRNVETKDAHMFLKLFRVFIHHVKEYNQRKIYIYKMKYVYLLMTLRLLLYEDYDSVILIV